MRDQNLSVKKKVIFSITATIIVILFAVAIGEIGVRIYGSHDEIGDFYVGNTRLKPYNNGYPPRLNESLTRYLSGNSQFMAYDSGLGWSPVPNGRSDDGLFRYNSSGIRSDGTEYSLTPRENVLRIAIFGDSFTEGDEVPYESTWGHYLETYLNEAGVDAEVLNFGVSAYGMDQALLRWKKQGKKFSPNIVIFGFQAENALRNVNLFRNFYSTRTGVIFTKPRFILESDQLELINIPTVPPNEVRQVISNFREWKWADSEYYYNESDYSSHVWRRFKAFSLIENRLEKVFNTLNTKEITRNYYQSDRKIGHLAMKIIEEFKHDVEANNSEFMVVHLPKRGNLTSMSEGSGLIYSELMEELLRKHSVLDPADELVKELKASSLKSLFMPNGHPSDKANQIIASVIAESLVGQELVNARTSVAP